MAFSEQSLVPLSRETQYFSLFSYETEDSIDRVSSDGYFRPAASLMQRGDLLLVYAGMSDSPAIGLFVVVEAEAQRNMVRVEDFAGLDVVKAQAHSFRLVPKVDANQIGKQGREQSARRRRNTQVV